MSEAIKKLMKRAAEEHMSCSENWTHGEPVSAWYDEEGIFCVKYEDGSWWHYKDLDMPFPSWW